MVQANVSNIGPRRIRLPKHHTYRISELTDISQFCQFALMSLLRCGSLPGAFGEQPFSNISFNLKLPQLSVEQRCVNVGTSGALTSCEEALASCVATTADC